MPLVEAFGLTKRFPGVTALDDVSFAVEPGIIGLVGANGAGKSTLIKVLLGLLEPTKGEAFVLGHHVLREGARLRALVGYVPEHDCLPSDLPAVDFITHLAEVSGLPRSAARERTADVLRHVGLFEQRYRPLGQYSTGMKQRAKLAQALVHDPRLIFLDEPTNGLDPEGRDEMLRLIERTGREFGISMIFASHLLGELQRVCDFLLVLDGGRLMRSGPMASFVEATGSTLVEVDGEGAPAVDALRARGLTVEPTGPSTFVVRADDGAALDAVRDVVAELELGLVRLEPLRGTLEDLFRAEPVAEVAGDG